ncbi:hypothetical protein KUTeg_005493 [Tegillarca granosa]|uniref:Uncharacterized protein n=1 Tax=Tegillarca granosa TaxID=220873 RepID=A0ABQ9FJX6_TEGGR|nr:hypothetical protein KUTeg_005493 [Tegillarca granosa]
MFDIGENPVYVIEVPIVVIMGSATVHYSSDHLYEDSLKMDLRFCFALVFLQGGLERENLRCDTTDLGRLSTKELLRYNYTLLWHNIGAISYVNNLGLSKGYYDYLFLKLFYTIRDGDETRNKGHTALLFIGLLLCLTSSGVTNKYKHFETTSLSILNKIKILKQGEVDCYVIVLLEVKWKEKKKAPVWEFNISSAASMEKMSSLSDLETGPSETKILKRHPYGMMAMFRPLGIKKTSLWNNWKDGQSPDHEV